MLLLRRKGSVSRLVSYIYKRFLLLPVEDRVILGDLNLVDLFLAFQICFSVFVVNYSSPNSGWITLLCAVLCETCFVPPLQPVMAECPTYVCVRCKPGSWEAILMQHSLFCLYIWAAHFHHYQIPRDNSETEQNCYYCRCCTPHLCFLISLCSLSFYFFFIYS